MSAVQSETFPHPGGPHRMREGTSCDWSRARSSVCSPNTLFCPKYSSRVQGLIFSARGLSELSSFSASALICFRVSEAEPGCVGLSGALLGDAVTRDRPALVDCLDDASDLLLLLLLNSENTAAGGRVGFISGPLVPAAQPLLASLLTRDLLAGGSSSLLQPSSRHLSK